MSSKRGAATRRTIWSARWSVPEGADETLTNDEIISFAMLLLIAGNETTTNLIGNAMLALTEHPDELRKVSRIRR